MVGWLIQKWLNWRIARSRAIFHFWDGQRRKSLDPMLIWLKLKADPEFSIDKHPGLIDLGDDESQLIGVRAVQRAFGVKDFLQGGLTHLESLNLLAGFFEYLATQKKSINPTQTLLPPTESPPSEPSTTNAASDSGRTPAEPSSASQPV